jgi:hypothetical protein
VLSFISLLWGERGGGGGCHRWVSYSPFRGRPFRKEVGISGWLHHHLAIIMESLTEEKRIGGRGEGLCN